MQAPELSVVVPAYNEEGRLEATLRAAFTYLQQHHPRHELLVVDDGSTDGTAALVRNLQAALPTLALTGYPDNRGKGHAVRRGMCEARGARRLFMDADLSTPMEELPKLWRALDEGHDVAIGSRGLPESDLRVRQSWGRERMGKTFNLLVRALILRGYRDTQCGFKLMSAEAAQDVFGRTVVDGFAFDVEMLRLCEGRWSVAEVPVRWHNHPESSVSPGRDALRMFADLLRMRGRGPE